MWAHINKNSETNAQGAWNQKYREGIARDIQHRTKELTGLFIHTGRGTEQTAKQDTVEHNKQQVNIVRESKLDQQEVNLKEDTTENKLTK